jgi:hypothetical protein
MKEKTGFVYGDTLLTGMLIIKEDGSKEFVAAKEPIVYKTAKENNKK